MNEQNSRAPGGTSGNARPMKQRKTRTLNDPFRVSINEEAHLVLEGLIARCNNEFDGGTVSRSDVANRLILIASHNFSDVEVTALRNLCFDDRKMLHNLLQRSGKNGELPEEIRRALRELNGVVEQPKKRSGRGQKGAPLDSAGGTPDAA